MFLCSLGFTYTRPLVILFHILSKLNFSSICVSDVCHVCVCHLKCYRVTHLNISAKWSEMFMKFSANGNIGLLGWLTLFVGAHMHAHGTCKHAYVQLITHHISSVRRRIFTKVNTYDYLWGIKDAPRKIWAPNVLGRAWIVGMWMWARVFYIL